MSAREQADRILKDCGDWVDTAIPLWIRLQHLTVRVRDLYAARECAVYFGRKGKSTLTLWAYQGEGIPHPGEISRCPNEAAGDSSARTEPGLLRAWFRAEDVGLGVVQVRREPGVEFTQEDSEILEVIASSLAQPIR
ncbi:MAG TPA: hypothetical protein VN648_10935, partial [Candidatus Methylomirabilis sp.]|nr:hypothetical protein [Candidatus Methylomirabilis sp.]